MQRWTAFEYQFCRHWHWFHLELEFEHTVYLGNLNYNVKDEHVHEFFKDCGTITNIRWLTHRDTGNFKGAGYVNFTETHEVDAAVKKNACIFMGRPL